MILFSGIKERDIAITKKKEKIKKNCKIKIYILIEYHYSLTRHSIKREIMFIALGIHYVKTSINGLCRGLAYLPS